MTAAMGFRCDRCGKAGESRFIYCAGCSLFVCPRCWESAEGACLSCVRPGLPIAGQLRAELRKTVGDLSLRPDLASSSRVGRSMAAAAHRRQADARRPANLQEGQAGLRASVKGQEVGPGPGARRRSPLDPIGPTVLRVFAAGLVALALLIAVPALLDLQSGSSPRLIESSSATRVPVGRATPTPTEANTITTYVVRSGDTLMSISRRFYGTESQWELIYEANRRKIRDPDSLDTGARLVIPPTP